MIKNKLKILMILLPMLLISTTCFATIVSSSDATMEVVEDNTCKIKINEYSEFEKKMIDYDLEKRELTIQLKVTNTPGPSFDQPAEIMLVIDNSQSMIQRHVTADTTRFDIVKSSAKKLVTELLKNDKAKVGVVKFSTSTNVGEEGTLKDATLLTTPVSNSTTILNAIDSINADGPRTDIDAGLQVAKQNLSNDDTAKYIILLTDGVPNTAVGGPTITYSGEIVTKTKATLTSIVNANINLYTMMTGLDGTIEPQTQRPYTELAEEIFGTSAEPYAGKYYNIQDSQIEKTICETILKDITKTVDSTLHNVKIYDYFPQEIVDNFDFSYVAKPTKGTISETITENNYILWTIDELLPTDTLTVTYKLTLKDNIDDSILGKILKTNEKVDIESDEEDDKTSDEAPKVKVTKPEVKKSTVTVKYLEKDTNKPLADETVITDDVGNTYSTSRKTISGYVAADPEPTNKEGIITSEPITVIYYYTTKAPNPIPQTGDTNGFIIAIGSIFVISTAVFGIRLYTIKKK
ncbi:MAG: VWA domain-containing protein [Clostridia bacterium]|nr:VWA domain-containing protein [Clostridia bacterium]